MSKEARMTKRAIVEPQTEPPLLTARRPSCVLPSALCLLPTAYCLLSSVRQFVSEARRAAFLEPVADVRIAGRGLPAQTVPEAIVAVHRSRDDALGVTVGVAGAGSAAVAIRNVRAPPLPGIG